MSYQRRVIAGHFSRRTGPQHVGISEDEARRLLASNVRNVDEAIATLKRSPLSPLSGDNCLVVFEVHKAPVETVQQGGPHLAQPAAHTDQEIAEWLLDLHSQVAPASYDLMVDRYQEIRPAQIDAFAASLMEQLDNLCGPEITFTVREVNGVQVLGFWPIEMPESETTNEEPQL